MSDETIKVRQHAAIDRTWTQADRTGLHSIGTRQLALHHVTFYVSTSLGMWGSSTGAERLGGFGLIGLITTG